MMQEPQAKMFLSIPSTQSQQVHITNSLICIKKLSYIKFGEKLTVNLHISLSLIHIAIAWTFQNWLSELMFPLTCSWNRNHDHI